MTKQLYHLDNIRELLTQGFDDRELRRLCYDVPDFRPVYDDLARTTGKAEIVDALLEYAERQLLIDTLLVLAKDQNPNRYEHHGLYYRGDPIPALQKQISDLNRRLAFSTAPPCFLYASGRVKFIRRRLKRVARLLQRIQDERAYDSEDPADFVDKPKLVRLQARLISQSSDLVHSHACVLVVLSSHDDLVTWTNLLGEISEESQSINLQVPNQSYVKLQRAISQIQTWRRSLKEKHRLATQST